MFVDNQVYQYVSMTLATTFLVPQLYYSYKKQTAKDISYVSLLFIFLSSGLWGCYMYEKNLHVYAFATFFVTFTCILLMILKCITYLQRIKEHYDSFEQPASAAIPVQVQTQV